MPPHPALQLVQQERLSHPRLNCWLKTTSMCAGKSDMAKVSVSVTVCFVLAAIGAVERF